MINHLKIAKTKYFATQVAATRDTLQKIQFSAGWSIFHLRQKHEPEI